MARSSGLALYLATRALSPARQAGPGQAEEAWAARPDGALVWFHAGVGTRVEALTEFARRLSGQRQRCTALLSGDDDAALPRIDGLLAARVPAETPRAMRRFLDHWRPDAAVFAGGMVHPVAALELQARGVPVILVDAHVPQMRQLRSLWAPLFAGPVFRSVTHLLAASEAEAAAFRRLGAPADRVEVVGFLEEGTAPIACNERDRSALAQLLAARPVWLAVFVNPVEIDAVLTAHTRATRVAHRSLLILVPSAPEDAPHLTDRITAAGWTVAHRAQGAEPDPDVQVFVADGTEELGLWYRLAPITFLGSSLVPGGVGRDPFEPAALGSAILVGPDAGPFQPVVNRFLRAGAARTVVSGEALGDAVADLLAPDRTAEMARRAWEITSSGAEVTDRLLEIIGRALDNREPA